MKANRKCTCDYENVIVYIFFYKNIMSLFTPYFRVNRDSLKKTIKNEIKITEVLIFAKYQGEYGLLTYFKKKNLDPRVLPYGTELYPTNVQSKPEVYIYKFCHCKASTSNTKSPLRVTVGG